MLFKNLVRFLFLAPSILFFTIIVALPLVVESMLRIMYGPVGMLAFIYGPVITLILSVIITIICMLFVVKVRINSTVQIFIGTALLLASFIISRMYKVIGQILR